MEQDAEKRLQKSLETLEAYIQVVEEYNKNSMCGGSKQLLQNRPGCNFYADEGRCHGTDS